MGVTFLYPAQRQRYSCSYNNVVYFVRSLPKISRDEEEGVHQNPQYTGQHHFHPVPHDHDFCERVVINVSNIITICTGSQKINL